MVKPEETTRQTSGSTGPLLGALLLQFNPLPHRRCLSVPYLNKVKINDFGGGTAPSFGLPTLQVNRVTKAFDIDEGILATEED